MRKYLLVLSLITVGIPTAFAGNGGVGGGDAFICSGRVFLADTYDSFSKPNQLNSRRLKGLFTYLISRKMAEILVAKKPALNVETITQTIRDSAKSLQFIKVHRSLPDLPDDNINVLPLGCEKAQLAIQNISTGDVTVDDNLERQLDENQDEIFHVHEAVIHVRRDLGIDTTYTTETRDLVMNAFTSMRSFLESHLLGDVVSGNDVYNTISFVTGIFPPRASAQLDSLKATGMNKEDCKVLSSVFYILYGLEDLVLDFGRYCGSYSSQDLITAVNEPRFNNRGGCNDGHPYTIKTIRSKLKPEIFGASLPPNQTVVWHDTYYGILTNRKISYYSYKVMKTNLAGICKIP